MVDGCTPPAACCCASCCRSRARGCSSPRRSASSSSGTSSSSASTSSTRQDQETIPIAASSLLTVREPDRLEHRGDGRRPHRDPDPDLLDGRAALHRARHHRRSRALMATVSLRAASARSTATARARSPTSTSRSRTASSWSSSARRAAARRRRCGWSPGSRTISEGEIRIGGPSSTGSHPRKRDIAMVFQNYALYPHMSVYKNIAFGCRCARRREAEIRRAGRGDRPRPRARRSSAAQAGAALRRPAPARGDGPRDRAQPAGVPDGRAALEPRREAARPDARRDRAHPARARGDDDLRHARPGRGDDDGRPRRRPAQGRRSSRCDRRSTSTSSPANLFVASFIGSPAMNLVQARLERGRREARLPCRRPAACSCRTHWSGRASRRSRATSAARSALGIRPEHLQDAALADGAAAGGRARGRVVTTELLGSELLAHVEVEPSRSSPQEVLEVAGDVDRALRERPASEAREQRARPSSAASTPEIDGAGRRRGRDRRRHRHAALLRPRDRDGRARIMKRSAVMTETIDATRRRGRC